MKVLVVDDEQLVRWFLERALKKWGHEVTSAPSGQDALALLDGSSFDVLFTDLRMPEGNGAHLIKQVSDMPQKCKKIVVCSAFITSEMAKDYESKGILTLKKPFKLNELESVLQRCEEDPQV
ncbi:MAG TPA: response regulator [Nitrospirae bacterium]|nr:response regulator [Nitrospirota bacterium]